MGLTEPREAQARGRAEADLAGHATTGQPVSEDGRMNHAAASVPAPPGPAPREEVLSLANLEIRPTEFQLLADGRRVGLTVREFQTFLVLAERPDRVVTRPEIYALVWGGQ